MKLRRYQLNKAATGLIARHPWVFREQMSSAANALPDGAWLRLFDGQNQIVGSGIYEAEGAIAIRVLRRGPEAPDAAWVRAQIEASIARRAPLRDRTTAMRVVHGESDGLPAVTIDKFGDAIVVQSYSLGADALARYAGILVKRALGGRIVERAARRRRRAETEVASVDDATDVVAFTEDGVDFAVDLGGQKSGAYLDLRGLRHAIAQLPLAGARVLNLFSYSGMLGRIAERTGAAQIVQVDQSQRALDFARAHHVDDPSKHALVVTDAFAYRPEGEFDLAIVDPPSMTSSMQQIPAALAAYRKLYATVGPTVKPGGLLVAACCTSRIDRKTFHKTVAAALPGFTHERDLPTEIDHPIGFPQADYLKIGLWRRATGRD